MNQQLLFGVAVVPAIIGPVGVCTSLGIPTRAAPALAVLFGILAGLAEMYGVNLPWVQAAVVGLGLGLSSVGLHASARTAVKPTKTPLIATRRDVTSLKTKSSTSDGQASEITPPWQH